MRRTKQMVLCALMLSCTGKYIRPTTNEVVQPTPERLARGQYLVTNVASCGACHTTRDSGNLVDAESTTALLGGQNLLEDSGMGIKLWVPNITSDLDTGVGSWSDDQLMRAIRDGVRADGTFLFPVMPYSAYQHISDEDLRAIVAYLRSVPKVKASKPRVENQVPFPLGFFIGRGVAMHTPVHDVPPPNFADPVKHGEYLNYLGHCAECHSLGGTGARGPETDTYMGGSDGAFQTPGVGKVWAPNLTPDMETGIGKYSAEQIKLVLTTGKGLDGRTLMPPMALFIPHVSSMKPEDMDALVAWLKSLKPVKKQTPKRELTPEGKKLAGES